MKVKKQGISMEDYQKITILAKKIDNHKNQFK